MMKKAQIMQDWGAPPPDDPGTIHCDTCGWYHPGGSLKTKRCPKCGRILKRGQLEKIFQHGINEQSVKEFKNVMRQMGLPDDQISELSSTLEHSIPTTAPEGPPEPEKPFTPETPQSPPLIKEVMQPGKALEPLKQVISELDLFLSENDFEKTQE